MRRNVGVFCVHGLAEQDENLSVKRLQIKKLVKHTFSLIKRPRPERMTFPLASFSAFGATG